MGGTNIAYPSSPRTSVAFSPNAVLAFTVWCSSGVSALKHLKAGLQLMQSLYRFHAYYQVHSFLDEIQTQLGFGTLLTSCRWYTKGSTVSLGYPDIPIGTLRAQSMVWAGCTTTGPAMASTRCVPNTILFDSPSQNGHHQETSTWTTSSRIFVKVKFIL